MDLTFLDSYLGGFDTDLMIVVGIVILILSIPGIISAFSDRRFPKFAFLMALIGGLLVGYVLTGHPDKYTIATFPDVVIGVIGNILN